MPKKENDLPAGGQELTTALLEAALFLSYAPLSFAKLRKICRATAQQLRDSLKELEKSLDEKKRGLVLLETEEGYQLGTRPDLSPYLEELLGGDGVATPLSSAALEVLAIIASKQPVTRLEIERIRGVSSEGVLDNLLNRGLIQVAGRKETLGRPFLYGVTSDFLSYFGLKDLAELQELQKEENW